MRTYVIVNTSDLASIDYSQLLTTSTETTMRNIAGDKAIVKYIGDMPSTIISLSSKTLYTHEEIMPIVESSEWRGQPDDV
tara:strand:+ start:173 stop:412 length:240 start_codon:yes stop_codon:yes gene_type:complete